MTYIAKDGITNSEKRRREALDKAEFYDGLRRQFVEWAEANSKPEWFITQGLIELQVMSEHMKQQAEIE